MKKVAIIYICTGEYLAFWKGFYDSFEKHFLTGYEKHYYVFSDNPDIYQKDNPRIHYSSQEHFPWPIIALMKFNIAMRVANELETYDFVYITNANIICKSEVTADEFLPRKELGENFVFTSHPGYVYDKKYNRVCYTEYERNRQSLAYIPYHIGKTYVFGNMWGGPGKEYVRLIKELDRRIAEDLKKRIIAIWHDESYVNHYVVTHQDYRILHPGYCYPVGFESNFEKKIIGVPKATLFDINQFKGYYTNEENLATRCLKRIKNMLKGRCLPVFYCARDAVLKRKPAE